MWDCVFVMDLSWIGFFGQESQGRALFPVGLAGVVTPR
ncbi:hypothetical protein VDG1235_3103 [Verrucomicrobiia bacterium DG1235]|nr:hypothetical protein VDG1235_3103 [Verrucomicrobiae bacterium DG1235]